MSTDPWEVNRGNLPANSLLVSAEVAEEMNLYTPEPDSYDEQHALQTLAAEQSRQQENRLNHELIGQFVIGLPPRADGSNVRAQSLPEAKLIQRSVIFDVEPFYLIGHRPTDDPKRTEILLAPAVGNQQYLPRLRKMTVYTSDLELRDEAVIALHKAEYTPQEVHGFSAAGGGLNVSGDHPRSMRIAQPPIFSVVPSAMHAPNLQRGIRETLASRRSLENVCDSFPDGISNKDVESFGVYDYLAELAAAFNKTDLLGTLVEQRYPSTPTTAVAKAAGRFSLAGLGKQVKAAVAAFKQAR